MTRVEISKLPTDLPTQLAFRTGGYTVANKAVAPYVLVCLEGSGTLLTEQLYLFAPSSRPDHLVLCLKRPVPANTGLFKLSLTPLPLEERPDLDKLLADAREKDKRHISIDGLVVIVKAKDVRVNIFKDPAHSDPEMLWSVCKRAETEGMIGFITMPEKAFFPATIEEASKPA